MKFCNGCNRWLSEDEFYRYGRSNDRLRPACKHCARDEYQKNAVELRKKARERRARYKKEDLESWRHKNWLHNLKHNHGLTEDEYLQMLERQSGGCAVCGGPPLGPGRFAVDHNHRSGQIRGLLCSNCNRGIGHLQDDPELLEAAAAYLREWRLAERQASFMGVG